MENETRNYLTENLTLGMIENNKKNKEMTKKINEVCVYLYMQDRPTFSKILKLRATLGLNSLDHQQDMINILWGFLTL